MNSGTTWSSRLSRAIARKTWRSCSGLTWKQGRPATRIRLTSSPLETISIQAGKQVARFGSVGDIHAFDNKRDVSLGKLLHRFIAMRVRAVKDSEVGPFAFRFSSALIAGRLRDRASEPCQLKNDCCHGGSWQRCIPAFHGFFVAGGLQRRALISKCIASLL